MKDIDYKFALFQSSKLKGMRGNLSPTCHGHGVFNV